MIDSPPSQNCLGAISRPSSFDLPSSQCGSYALFQNAFNPSIDFTRDNNFRDDPTHFNEGSLVGPDGVHMQIAPVDDEKVRNDISESVLSRVCFTAVFDNLPCCAAGGSAMSLGGPGAYFAADSGTRYTIMTMATAQDWDGEALAELMFVGVSGSPFPVFGGDDMVAEIQDMMGIWRSKNFGKAFVSPHANLDLASSYEMQSHELGTIFELDGSAWLVDSDGIYFPLIRKDGNFSCVFLLLAIVLVPVSLLFRRRVAPRVCLVITILIPMAIMLLAHGSKFPMFPILW